MPEHIGGKTFYSNEELADMGEPRLSAEEENDLVRRMQDELARQRAAADAAGAAPVVLPRRFVDDLGGTEYEDWSRGDTDTPPRS